jgi:Alpha/beta hydrolase family
LTPRRKSFKIKHLTFGTHFFGGASMRRLAAGRWLKGCLAGLAFLTIPHASRAADAERVKFYSYDQVELHGSFYIGDLGKKSPCAILLHSMGASSDQEGWADLAKRLQQEHFAVLTFDFRGHGESINVQPTVFWSPVDPLRTNLTLKGYQPGKLRDQISYKDFRTRDQFLNLVQDIAAAKHYLDQRNDSGDCNSSNLCLIGAESGATLGALWIRSEWERRALPSVLLVPAGNANRLEGEDITCAVWLSISSQVGVASNKWNVPVDSWLRYPAVKDKVSMFFLYGEQDQRSARFAHHLFSNVLHADRQDSKLKYTVEKAIKDTKLAGRDLLKPSLPTEDLIRTYVTKVFGDKGLNTWVKREADRGTIYPVPFLKWVRGY